MLVSGIRLHAAKLIRGLSELLAGKAQLGLGHSYSRTKVKFNVNPADNIIIQSSSLCDQMEKDVNANSMRLWYVSSAACLCRMSRFKNNLNRHHISIITTLQCHKFGLYTDIRFGESDHGLNEYKTRFSHP